MNLISPINKPYEGEIIGSSLIGNVSKIYFTNILRREPFPIYQWALSDLSQKSLIKGIEKHLDRPENKNYPHIIVSFPHNTVVYKWEDYRFGGQETNLEVVGMGKTVELENIIITDKVAPKRIGCPAELFIIGEEAKFKSNSQSLLEYLSKRIPNGKYAGSNVKNPNMIREYLEANNLS